MIQPFLFVSYLAFFLSSFRSTIAEQVKIDIYYETLCPDSIKYLVKEVFPVYNSDLGKKIDLQLYPFGKATFEKKSESEYLFKCHHGVEECKGNTINACILKRVEEPYKYIQCLLEDSSRVYSNEKMSACFKSDDEKSTNDLSKVQECVNTTDGNQLLYEYGQMTKAVQDPLKFVPFTVFNKEVDEVASDKAYANSFKSLVCKHINEPALAECQNLKSSAVIDNLSVFVTLFASLLIFI